MNCNPGTGNGRPETGNLPGYFPLNAIPVTLRKSRITRITAPAGRMRSEQVFHKIHRFPHIFTNAVRFGKILPE